MYKLKETPVRKKTNVQLDLEKPKTTMFYNEIIGIIIILFTIIVFLRLGDIGIWLYKICKVLFGEVYFCYLIILIFIGFTNVFNHKKFDYKNQKFIGIIILLLDISIFCHIPIYNHIKYLDGNYFKNTWDIYYAYITLDTNTILGGGLIGSLIFYIILKLFSFSGVIIISILILIFGLSIFINKSFNEMMHSLKLVIKSLRGKVTNFNNFFKYDIGVKKVVQIKKKNFTIPLRLFDNQNSDLKFKFQEKLGLENKQVIEAIFRKYDIEYRYIELSVSYNATLYKYYIYSNLDKYSLYNQLKNQLTEKVLIGYSDNKLLLEVTNESFEYLYLKTLLIKQTSLTNNYILPIGINTFNDLVEIDFTKVSGILIDGNEVEAKNFITSIVYEILIKNNSSKVKFRYFDESTHLDDIFNNDYNTQIYNIVSFLDDFINLVDTRLKILEKNKVNDINEYNLKQEIDESNNMLDRIILVINTFNEIDEEIVNEKLFYILECAIKVGVNVIYYRNSNDKYYGVFRLFDNTIYFRSSTNIDTTCLTNECDVFYKKNSKTIRMAVAKVFEKETKVVMEYLKK